MGCCKSLGVKLTNRAGASIRIFWTLTRLLILTALPNRSLLSFRRDAGNRRAPHRPTHHNSYIVTVRLALLRQQAKRG